MVLAGQLKFSVSFSLFQLAKNTSLTALFNNNNIISKPIVLIVLKLAI